MKNLYLYISQNVNELCKMQDVFCFKNNKVIGIDKYEYSKLERQCLQERYNIYPYPLSQAVLREILIYAREKSSEFLIRGIYFADDSVIEEPEYEHLIDLILKNKTDDIFDVVVQIVEDFDTDIQKIVLRYKGYEISLSSTGVLTIEAPEEILLSFFMNNKANKLILGLS